LLLAREQIEAEQAPDTRPSIAEVFGACVNEAAERSADRVAYRTASASHTTSVKQHTARLMKERPMPDGAGLADLQRLYVAAVEAAGAEGHGPADELIRAPEPAPLPVDPLERARKATLPKATLRDLEDTKTATAEERLYSSIRAEADARYHRPAPPELLADYRGSDPPLHPPSYNDS
jgi:hypothetical protein